MRNRGAPGETPATSFCWPIDVVETNGSPAGILLPRATQEFFRDARKLRTLEFLYLYRTDPPDTYQRVCVLLAVLKAFAVLANKKLIHGDVAPKNIVWSISPSPRVFVLDVDGVHREGGPYSDHVVTPDWEDPRVVSSTIVGHDLSSDWYALALLVLRTLLCSRFVVQAGKPPTKGELAQYLPSPFVAALHPILGTETAHLRPSPQDWIRLIVNHFFPNNVPNRQAFAAADVAVARRRRWERRSGYLGPPFSELSAALTRGIGIV